MVLTISLKKLRNYFGHESSSSLRPRLLFHETRLVENVKIEISSVLGGKNVMGKPGSISFSNSLVDMDLEGELHRVQKWAEVEELGGEESTRAEARWGE